MNRTDKRDDGASRRGTQRSVAELLARYGEPSSGGRRHRRAAEPARAPRLAAPSHSRGGGPHGPVVRGRRTEPQDPAPTEDSRLDPPVVDDDPVTQLSRIDPALRDPALAPTPLPGAGRPQRGEPPAGLAPRPGGPTIALAPGGAAPPAPEPEPVAAVPGVGEQAGYDGEEPEDGLSSAREWAVVAGQVGLGVVGGGGLWLVCEWLWQSIPVLALVVALLVITSLVWVVRHVRRTEDLQTTVIAVLVGLFVTVSPAALLLVSR